MMAVFVLAQHCWPTVSFRSSRAPTSLTVNCSIACLCHLIISDEISGLKCIFTEQHPTLPACVLSCRMIVSSEPVLCRTPCSLPASVEVNI